MGLPCSPDPSLHPCSYCLCLSLASWVYNMQASEAWPLLETSMAPFSLPPRGRLLICLWSLPGFCPSLHLPHGCWPPVSSSEAAPVHMLASLLP